MGIETALIIAAAASATSAVATSRQGKRQEKAAGRATRAADVERRTLLSDLTAREQTEEAERSRIAGALRQRQQAGGALRGRSTVLTSPLGLPGQTPQGGGKTLLGM